MGAACVFLSRCFAVPLSGRMGRASFLLRSQNQKTTMKRIASLLTALVIMCGCATSSDWLNRINLGMTKQEVIQQIGPAHTTAAQGNVEILTYWMDREQRGGKEEYYIRLVGGKVESFGHKGDFGTTVEAQKREEITIINKGTNESK